MDLFHSSLKSVQSEHTKKEQKKNTEKNTILLSVETYQANTYNSFLAVRNYCTFRGSKSQ